jgi:uncharacterized RmlC-like cupin family protein
MIEAPTQGTGGEMASRRVRKVSIEDRTEGPSTPGMDRFTAIEIGGLWAGGARTEPGSVSGWHHHGEQESAVYVVSGALRMEFGPGGLESFDAGPGDFVHVPRGAVHRENPGADPSDIVVVRAGEGASIVNVEGPDPA